MGQLTPFSVEMCLPRLILVCIGLRRNSHMLTITAVVAGVGVVYLRVFRGWRLTDMMYVTRSSLTKSLSSVSSGVFNQQLTLVQYKFGT